MKLKLMASIVVAALAFAACDDSTDEIGTSLIANLDNLDVSTDTFEVTTQSVIADSVYSRSTVGYLGKVRDPETGAYITSDFTTQFYVLDNAFPPIDSIVSYSALDAQGKKIVYADSCDIYLTYGGFYGDSLATMKLSVNELAQPMSESVKYYSNYSPEEAGLVRSNGLKVNKVYSLTDLNVSDSLRNSGYAAIKIKLNKPYTDTEGNTYNNYGTYIMRKFYSEDSVCFKDPYKFIHEVSPGFYIKNTAGLGSMAYIANCRLNVYFRMNSLQSVLVINADSTRSTVKKVLPSVGAASFYGTEEVTQLSRVDNDNSTLQRLVDDNTCTYIKSPAGIFTEMTLPVDEIMKGHENDTLNTAKVTLTRINNKTVSDYSLDIPQTLLMLPKSQLYSFFENNEIADYKTSFLASFTSTYNTYTFNNIGTLVKTLYNNDRSDPDWNKVIIVPVTATYTTYNQTQVLTKVEHDMTMTSTRLVGGSDNPYGPIKISVIYSKFK